MLRRTPGARRATRLSLAAAAGVALVAAVTAIAMPAQATPDSPKTGATQRYGVMPTVSGAAARATTATSANTLFFGGGIDGIGVTTGHPKVYLVFYGKQWGTQSTDSSGNLKFTNDAKGGAPKAQMLFKGMGTGGEAWSGTMTQYCQGVATGASTCPASAPHVPYPTGGVLAGVWYDNAVSSPSVASGHQLGLEALKAAHHFGNTTAALNRNAFYVILSPHGTNPDSYQGQYCAWHDYNRDSTLTGGAITSDVGDFAFSNQPYNMDSGAGCGVNFLNSGSAGTLDGWTMTLGHEYSENITDQNPPGGWTASSGYENADECAWLKGVHGGAANVRFGNGTYTLQGSWSNDTNRCEITHVTVT